MNKKIFTAAFLVTLLASFAGFAAEDKPLMVIRFNQDIVNYEKPLQKAVSAAIRVKPATFFDIVSITPKTGKYRKDKLLRRNSEFLTSEIVENILNSGIKDGRIRVTYQDSELSDSSEVHIFVR